MKYFVLMIFLLPAAVASGQNFRAGKAPSDFRKIQFGINISPDICYRTLINDSENEFIKEYRDGIEIPKAGYSAGMSLAYHIGKNFGIETGIQYSNKGLRTKMVEIDDSSLERPDAAVPEKHGLIDNFHYLDIPVKANFFLGTKKLRFVAGAGIAVNFLVKSSHTSIKVFPDRTDKTTHSHNEVFRKMNLSPFVSLGIDYKLNDKINIRVEPTFRYGILKIIDSPSAHLFSGGVNIGCYFGL